MAENDFIGFFRHYLLKLKSFFLSKDVLSFLLFLLLSASFWFVNVLDKVRETTIEVPVRYVSVPQNIEFTNNVPISVKVSIRDNGKELLNYSRRNIKPIAINFNRQFYQKGTIVISPEEIRQVLSSYFAPSTAILQIQPDSLIVDYRKLESRNIPVKLDANISLAHQYVLGENVEIEPSNVAVIGAGQMFESLNFVKTELLELHNLKDTVSRVVKLKPLAGMRFIPNEVKVKLLVERFTEKKIKVPVTVINCPDDLVLRVFPSQVELSFNVAMSRFSNVNVSSIRVVFDYNQLNGNNKTKYTLKVEYDEALIKNLRVSPSEVEYLIEEKVGRIDI